MGYYIDFSKVSLADYKKRLMTVHLVPSRMLLRDNIDAQFDKIAENGISNIAELLAALKTAGKLSDFTASTGVDENYLKILNREIKSTIPKPNKITDFPNISAETAAALESAGIKKSTELYDRIITAAARAELAAETGLDAATVMKLTNLTDLSRVQWVNHTFAWMLYELGYDTAEKLASAEVERLHAELNRFNAEHGIYHHPFGIDDMHRVIFAANEIPFEVEY